MSQIEKYSMLSIYTSKYSQNLRFFMISFIFFLLFQTENIMFQIFILIVSNHRKNGYFLICHPRILQISSTADFVSMWCRILGDKTKFYILILFILGEWRGNNYPTSTTACSWNVNIKLHSIDSQVYSTEKVNWKTLTWWKQ